MRVLRSINKPKTHCDLIEFDVNELMIVPSMKWLKKRLPGFDNSVEQSGMIWPVIVTDLHHYWQKEKNWPKDDNGNYKPGLIVHTGNKRVLYARKQGYTHIEGYFVKSKDEKDKIIQQTFIHRSKWPNIKEIKK